MNYALTVWMCMEDMRFSTNMIARCTSPVGHPDCRWATIIDPVD